MNIQSITGVGAPPVQPLGPLSNVVQLPQVRELLQVDEHPMGFSSLLDAYMGIVNEAGRTGAHAQQLSMDFALGNTDDMLSVILAGEMAYTSMYFAVQVTSRMIEAYREIMRMQL